MGSFAWDIPPSVDTFVARSALRVAMVLLKVSNHSVTEDYNTTHRRFHPVASYLSSPRMSSSTLRGVVFVLRDVQDREALS